MSPQHQPSKLNYIRIPTPNLPGARNIGVQAATGEIIVFVDDDVVIEPGFLSAYAQAFREPGVGGASGITLTPGEQEPTLDDIDARFYILERLGDGRATVSWLVGCNCAYLKQAIVEAGMSDERFTGSAWSEDVDLSVRVRHAGYRFIYDPAIRLTHLALPSGGCANRRQADEEKRDEHRYLLFLYFVLKNRAILGAKQTVRNVWITYRNYAFNRPLFVSGRLRRRQALFLKNFFAALRMASEARQSVPRT